MIFWVANSKRAAVVVLAVAVVGSVLLVPGAAAAPATVTASGATTVQPGETVTVSVTLTNTGSSEDNYIADVSLPEEWSVESHADDGGTWNSGDVSWLWQNLAANSSVTPSVTLAVPSDAEGAATVDITAKTNDGTEDTATHTVTVEAPADDDSGSNDDGSDGGSSDDGGSNDSSGGTDDGSPSDDSGSTESGDGSASDEQASDTGSEERHSDGSASDAEPQSASETVAEQLDRTEPDAQADVTIEDTDAEREGVTVDTSETGSVQELTFDDAVSGTVEITAYDTPPEAVREQIAASIADGLASSGSDGSDTGSTDGSESSATDGEADTESDGGSSTEQSAPSVTVVSVTDISPSSESAARTSATVTLTADADRFTDPTNAYVAHETADGWERLETTVTETSNGEVTLEATTDSFSLFAVVEHSPPQDPQTDSTAGGGVPPAVLIAAGLAAVVVLGTVVWVRR